MAGPTSYCAPGNSSTTAAAIRWAALWRRISSVGSAGAGSGAPASAASSTISSGMRRRFYAVGWAALSAVSVRGSAGQAGHPSRDVLTSLAQRGELRLGVEAGWLKVEPQLTQHRDRTRGRAACLVAQTFVTRRVDRATIDSAILRCWPVHGLLTSNPCADAARHDGSL